MVVVVFVVVVLVHDDVVFVVVLNVDVVVYATSKVGLRLLVKEVEWWLYAKSFSWQTKLQLSLNCAELTLYLGL